jgi:alpha-beta hydrolase superfamily lysophospholipase
MQVLRYCIAALCGSLAVLGTLVGAQEAVAPAAGEATFLVFLGGREVGREQVSLSRTGSGWTISSTGRLAAPQNLTNNRFQITYAPDWQPIELRIDARVQDRSLALATSFATTTAINEITQNGVTNSKNDQISVRTVVIPNNFYAAYEALAVRLSQSSVGADIPVYVAPQGEIRMTVTAVTPSTFQTPAGPLAMRRFAVTFQNPGGPLPAHVTVDDRNRLAKLEMGAGSLTVTRADLASVAIRQHSFRNPTDTDVQIPAAGFSLAGTVTTPPAQGRLRHPAVVLVPGSGPLDRDSAAAGIPIFGQLAGQLAEAGYAVFRYDKRGVGQSGGRTETVTLRDYADDAVAAVKWIARRKDVDDKRVFVVGHGEGAAVAMLAAKEKRIKALVLMAAMGTTGRELILEQQQYLLDAGKVADPERTAKVELQKKILDAAVAEKGWEELPPEVRGAVDTPWYRSLLLFDPARVLKDVRQPILILHGGLDRQVPPHHAEQLAGLARARKKSPPVELRVLPALNHLMVAAKTGDISEYDSLEPKTIDPAVAGIMAEWLAAVPR